MPAPIQFCLFAGFAGLMLLLRLDARRFGAAEWDTQTGSASAWLPRLTWYAAGLGLALMVFALYPSPVADLHLVLAPDQGGALVLGLVYAAAGIAAAFILAVLTNGHVSFPRPDRYPGGAVYAIGTAFYDEFLFRGVILGLLLTLGLPDWLAVGFAAVIYAGAVSASAGGRGLLGLLVPVVIGAVGGVLVLMTGGIAAALIGHAATRFALFLTMGPLDVAAPTPEQYATTRLRATADSRAWVIPPRTPPSGKDGDDGRGGVGPLRPA
jgi:hypothetical protein